MTSYRFTNSFAEAIFIIFEDATAQYGAAGSLGAAVVVYTTTAQVGHIFPEGAIANHGAGNASIRAVLYACTVGGLILYKVGGSDFDVTATVDATVIDSSAIGAGNILYEGAIFNVYYADTFRSVIKQGSTVVSLVVIEYAVTDGGAGGFAHGTIVIPGATTSFAVTDDGCPVGIATGDNEPIYYRFRGNARGADNVIGIVGDGSRTDMAGKNGLILSEVAFFRRLLRSDKTAEQLDAVGNLEGGLAISSRCWVIGTLSYPYLLTFPSYLQGLLQVAHGVRPGLPVALTAAFDIDNRLRLHSPCHSH